MREAARHVVEHDVDVARDQVLYRAGAALVGDMQHVGAGELLEHLAGEMNRGARTGRGHVVLARVGLQQRDQFRHGLGRHAGMDHQHVRPHRHAGHRREILGRIVGQLGVERRRHAEHGDGDEADRVAVGGCLGDRVGADGAAATRLVVDQNLLAENIGHLGHYDARDVVGRAGRRIGHDELDRLAGERVLRTREAGRGEGRGKGRGSAGQHGTTGRLELEHCSSTLLFLIYGADANSPSRRRHATPHPPLALRPSRSLSGRRSRKPVRRTPRPARPGRGPARPPPGESACCRLP